jgi:hypothetical protein
MQMPYSEKRSPYGCLTITLPTNGSSGFCRFDWDYFYRAGIARSLLQLVSLGRSPGISAQRYASTGGKRRCIVSFPWSSFLKVPN